MCKLGPVYSTVDGSRLTHTYMLWQVNGSFCRCSKGLRGMLNTQARARGPLKGLRGWHPLGLERQRLTLFVYWNKITWPDLTGSSEGACLSLLGVAPMMINPILEEGQHACVREMWFQHNFTTHAQTDLCTRTQTRLHAYILTLTHGCIHTCTYAHAHLYMTNRYSTDKTYWQFVNILSAHICI